MNTLYKLRECLVKERKDIENFFIPKEWFFDGASILEIKNNLIKVNPYDYLLSLIDNYIIKNKEEATLYSDGKWVEDSIIYSMFIRSSSSFDFDQSNSLDILNKEGIKETGTFIKTLLLLPHLKSMNVNLLYLLPVFKHSIIDKKGELGSPYATEDYYCLDQDLYDPLVSLDIDDQFKCLIEACHLLNIRVTIDLIPRTVSISTPLIVSHPEWFYWIDSKYKNNYKSPLIEGIGETVYPSKDMVLKAYQDRAFISHIKMFRSSPDLSKISEISKINDSTEILSYIEDKFSVSIAKAFSDQINDTQPAWSDITFFKMYLDNPEISKENIKAKHSPYIFSDTIKSNLYPGSVPNKELWEYLSNILVYYINKFDIDGSRIDMGHALPCALLSMIMEKARHAKKSFSFIAEELNTNLASDAAKNGYDCIVGGSFYNLPRIHKSNAIEYINQSMSLPIYAFAACETHDTKRVASREDGERLSILENTIKFFLKNNIPFINSGEEFGELAPMNIGLDSTTDDLYLLPLNDIFYSKLALFDKFSFHINTHSVYDVIVKCSSIRREYLNIIKYGIPEVEYTNNIVKIAYRFNDELFEIISNFSNRVNYFYGVKYDPLESKIFKDHKQIYKTN